jgi:clan AA aspartic protease
MIFIDTLHQFSVSSPIYDGIVVGLTTQALIVRPTRRSKRKVTVKFLVDSGAVYSLVPARILRKLGLRPYREVTFSLTDGTTVTRMVGDAYFEIDGNLGPVPVIFGEEGDEPLLGATTLESLGLVLDPFKRRLIPMRMVLA